jgi:hypothetical protein
VLRSSGEIALCVREDSAEAQKSKNPLRIRKVKLRRNNVSYENATKLRVKEFTEEKGGQRLRPLRTFEILPSLGRKCRSSGGSTAAVRSAGEKKIWTVGRFSRPGRSSGGAHRRILRSSDLSLRTRQPSDRVKLHRFNLRRISRYRHELSES